MPEFILNRSYGIFRQIKHDSGWGAGRVFTFSLAKMKME